MRVKDVMRKVIVVGPEDTVDRVSKLMGERKTGCVLVELSRHNHFTLTERDIVTKVVAKGRDPGQVRAREIMTELRYTIDAGATLQKSSRILYSYPTSYLPVMQNGEIVGVIAASDIADSACPAIR